MRHRESWTAAGLGGRTADGAGLQTWACAGAANQKWTRS
ncbi:RICIN domain-containing protein [Actinoplanes palleronii]|nr:RICIN domain-containing protein [Actinoplanes palleronii]